MMKFFRVLLISVFLTANAAPAFGAEAPKPLSETEVMQLQTVDRGQIDEVQAGDFSDAVMIGSVVFTLWMYWWAFQ